MGLGVGSAVGVARSVGVDVAMAEFVVAVAVAVGPVWPAVGTLSDDPAQPARAIARASAPNVTSRPRPARFGRMPGIFLSSTVNGHSLAHSVPAPTRTGA